MIERSEDRADVVLAQLPAGHGVVGVPRHLAVRRDHALGAARCARGIEQAVGVLGATATPHRVAGSPSQNQVGEIPVTGHRRFVEGDPVLHIHSRPQPPDRLAVILVVHQSPQRAVTDNELELGRRELCIQRHQHDAALARREKGVQKFNPIAGQHPNPVAGPQAEAVQPHAGTTHRSLVELAIAVAASVGHHHHGSAVRGELGPLADDVGVNHRWTSSSAGGSSGGATGGGSASACWSAFKKRSGHSRWGRCPQSATVVNRAAGSPSSSVPA